VLVYPAGSLSYDHLELDETPSLNDLQGAFQAICDDLAGANGGLFCQAHEGGEFTSVRVQAFPGKGFNPPKSAWVVGSLAEPRQIGLGSEAKLKVGEHVLVPVDKGSTKSLEKLLDHLRGLPPDTRSLFIESLRQPHLYYRVSRLEHLLTESERRPAFPPPEAPPRRFQWLRRLPWMLFLVALQLILVVVVLFMVWDSDRLGGRSGERRAQTAGERTPSGTGSKTSQAARKDDQALPAEISEHLTKIVRLVRAGGYDGLIGKQIDGLRKSHFRAGASGDDGLRPDATAITKALRGSEDGAVAAGFMKLWVLCIGDEEDSDLAGEMIRRKDAWEPTRRLVEERLKEMGSAKEPKHMLAWLACRIQFHDEPSLRAILPGGKDQDSLELVSGGSCGDVDLKAAASGFRDLVIRLYELRDGESEGGERS
jgi:hypothetical protein